MYEEIAHYNFYDVTTCYTRTVYFDTNTGKWMIDDQETPIKEWKYSNYRIEGSYTRDIFGSRPSLPACQVTLQVQDEENGIVTLDVNGYANLGDAFFPEYIYFETVEQVSIYTSQTISEEDWRNLERYEERDIHPFVLMRSSNITGVNSYYTDKAYPIYIVISPYQMFVGIPWHDSEEYSFLEVK